MSLAELVTWINTGTLGVKPSPLSVFEFCAAADTENTLTNNTATKATNPRTIIDLKKSIRRFIAKLESTKFTYHPNAAFRRSHRKCQRQPKTGRILTGSALPEAQQTASGTSGNHGLPVSGYCTP
jgi:hypothetical protein